MVCLRQQHEWEAETGNGFWTYVQVSKKEKAGEVVIVGCAEESKGGGEGAGGCRLCMK